VTSKKIIILQRLNTNNKKIGFEVYQLLIDVIILNINQQFLKKFKIPSREIKLLKKNYFKNAKKLY